MASAGERAVLSSPCSLRWPRKSCQGGGEKGEEKEWERVTEWLMKTGLQNKWNITKLKRNYKIKTNKPYSYKFIRVVKMPWLVDIIT